MYDYHKLKEKLEGNVIRYFQLSGKLSGKASCGINSKTYDLIKYQHVWEGPENFIIHFINNQSTYKSTH